MELAAAVRVVEQSASVATLSTWPCIPPCVAPAPPVAVSAALGSPPLVSASSLALPPTLAEKHTPHNDAHFTE